MNGKILLILGGIANFVIALLHLVIITLRAPAYAYFGAPQLVPLVEQGSLLPALLTFCLAVVFAAFGLYAFSGAGLVPRLPQLKWALLTIGAIYTLRGLLLFLELFFALFGARPPLHELFFSVVALLIGLCYLLGYRRLDL